MNPQFVKILLIEDDPNDAALFKALVSSLEKPRTKVSHVSDLEQGLRLIDAGDFDLIISDLALPDATNMEAINRIYEKQLNIPVLVLTGIDDDSLLNEAAHLNVYDYLYKSDMNLRSLSRSIRYTLSKYQADLKNKSLGDQLVHAQKMEAVGLLTGGIAHDFNNKLAIIKGHLELIAKSEEMVPQNRKSIDAIQLTVDQAAQLTNQLLAYSRRQEFEMQVIDLNKLISQSIDLLDRVLMEDVVVRKLTAPYEVFAEVDSGQIDQVLMNLIINARDALNGQGTIEVKIERASQEKQLEINSKLSRRSDYLCLSVSDDGPGMSQDTIDKIFDPFFSTKEIGKGTGLGLSVVDGIVSQHGGLIEVESTEGQGTCFKIYLPNSKASPTSQAVTLIEAKSRTAKTILYVEDDQQLRELFVQFFKLEGYKILQAQNGKEAIEIYKKNIDEVDLVITDVVMPQMTGKELFQELRKINPDIPLIFISGYSHQEIMEKGRLPFKTHFIRKPCSQTFLIFEIQSFLKKCVDGDSKNIKVA